MKTVLTSIITSIITVVIALFVVHAIWGDGECMFSDNDDDKECTEQVKKGCCDKKQSNTAVTHEMMMEKLAPVRAEFDGELTDEEKATIAGIREKFEDVDHENMCPEGMAKFQEQYKDDIAALTAIADNHKEFLDGLYAKMHGDKKCAQAAEEGEVVKTGGCPEAKACGEATEKCKGEQKTPEAEAKCKEAEAKCKEAEAKCQLACENTFKVHFLLLDEDDEDEGDDD